MKRFANGIEKLFSLLAFAVLTVAFALIFQSQPTQSASVFVSPFNSVLAPPLAR